MTDLRSMVADRRAELEHAPPPSPAPIAGFGDVDPVRVLQIVGLNPGDPKAHAVVAVAERYGLDPVLGHIQIISNSKMPYISRDGFLFIAHRSGQLDGIEVVDGPRREGAEWVASVAVYRKDMSRPFVYPGRADVGRDNGPEMALARAERRALRRAFAVTLPREFADDEHDVRAFEPSPGAHPDEGITSAVVDGQDSATPAPDGEQQHPDMIMAAQRDAMHAAFRELAITDRAERLRITCEIIGRKVGSANELTRVEATAVLGELSHRKLDARLNRDAEAARATQDGDAEQAVTDAQLDAAYEQDMAGAEPVIEEVPLPYTPDD